MSSMIGGTPDAASASAGTLRFWLPSAAGLLGLLAWDASGLDLALAGLMADAHGFHLAGSRFLAAVLHTGARHACLLGAALLLANLARPWGVFKAFPRRDLRWALLATLLCAASVAAVKHFSLTSCPWDLATFGGRFPYVSHWRAQGDGGPGGCFPAGHASSAFSFLPFYFLFACAPARTGRLARGWLAGVLALGMVLGLAQQLRGAHFMSHTLWSGWLCWTVACASWRLHVRPPGRRPPAHAARHRGCHRPSD